MTGELKAVYDHSYLIQLYTDDRSKPTPNVPFCPFSEKDGSSYLNVMLQYHSITAMPEYHDLSIEVC
jgi:hypothetical protein